MLLSKFMRLVKNALHSVKTCLCLCLFLLQFYAIKRVVCIEKSTWQARKQVRPKCARNNKVCWSKQRLADSTKCSLRNFRQFFQVMLAKWRLRCNVTIPRKNLKIFVLYNCCTFEHNARTECTCTASNNATKFHYWRFIAIKFVFVNQITFWLLNTLLFSPWFR